MTCEQLVLGTALLGADYGIAHTAKKITPTEFQSIMIAAWKVGVHSIDTAAAYGDSHRILGEIGIDNWSITTKLPSVTTKTGPIDEWYRAFIASTLQELGLQEIDTLLIHHVKELSGVFGAKLISLLRESQFNGDVRNIGVSIYSPQDMESFYSEFRPDVVQCPYNIFDQRIANSGWLQRLSNDGVEVHARSVFLQGILLRNFLELNSYFEPWYVFFDKWHIFCEKNNMSKLQAAIGFVKAENRIKKIIVGIEDIHQLQQILDAYLTDTPKISIDPCNEIALVNPLMWEIA